MAAESLLAGAKIIVLDDERANVILLERILQKEGYSNIVGFTDPNALFADQALNGVDLVLLDLHMPPPDGFSILEQLRSIEERDQLPILVLTADATAKSRNRALEIGASDYLTKPFDQVEVLLRVRNLLRTRFLHLRLMKTNKVLQDQILGLSQSGEARQEIAAE